MRALRFGLILAASTALTTLPAVAQPKAAPKATSGAAETRYFEIDGMIQGGANVIVKETRQGGKLTAATLDACYSADESSQRKDRFVVDLNVNGNELTGTTTTLVDKFPVSVNVTRKQSNGTFDFRGKIQVGNTVNDIVSTDNSDISEREFNEGVSIENTVTETPQDFTEVSPESVAVKVKLDNLAAFVGGLRGQAIEVSMNSLVTTCEALRAGEQTIKIAIDPLRAADFVAKAKTLPGVVSAGWSIGVIEMDRTMLIKADEWSEGGKLKRDSLASALAETLGKRLNAKLTETEWDPETAKLRLQFKRPSQMLPSLKLTDVIEYTLLAAPDKPGATQNLMLWVSTPNSTTSDDATGAKLILSDANGPENYNDPMDDTGEVAALRARFKAQRWNSETSVWE